MDVKEFLSQVEKYYPRFFPEARVTLLEELPLYIKVRLAIAEDIFIELRLNVRNRKQSYALMVEGERIAGFDNLGGWHLHPAGNPNRHRKIRRPTLEKMFQYFVRVLERYGES